MVSTQALIQALVAQHAQARQGNPTGRGGGSAPFGPLGPGQAGENGVAANPLAAAGISAGGVPGTATSGASIAAGLGGAAATSGDPLAQQVAAFTGNVHEPGERGDLGAGVTGFDRDLMLSVLSGNPLAVAAALANAVNDQNFTFGDAQLSGSAAQNQALQGSTVGQPPGFSVNQTSTPLSSGQAATLFGSLGTISLTGGANLGGSGGNLGGGSGREFIDPSGPGIGGGPTI